jgi:hypothetical protein
VCCPRIPYVAACSGHPLIERGSAAVASAFTRYVARADDGTRAPCRNGPRKDGCAPWWWSRASARAEKLVDIDRPRQARPAFSGSSSGLTALTLPSVYRGSRSRTSPTFTAIDLLPSSHCRQASCSQSTPAHLSKLGLSRLPTAYPDLRGESTRYLADTGAAGAPGGPGRCAGPKGPFGARRPASVPLTAASQPIDARLVFADRFGPLGSRSRFSGTAP